MGYRHDSPSRQRALQRAGGERPSSRHGGARARARRGGPDRAPDEGAECSTAESSSDPADPRHGHNPGDARATVVAIHVGPKEGGPLESVRSARVLSGHGVLGDRHFRWEGASSGQALTLVEDEVVRELGLPSGATRRQVTVGGVRLNGLVGKRFRIGDVECFGVKLCEPCRHLQDMTRPGIIKDLAHRAGIRADILTDGTLSVGDVVVELPST